MISTKGIFPAALTAWLLLFIAAAGFSYAGTDDSVSDSAFVVITLANQNPEPVMPGELIELKFKVENRGTKPANDVVVELMPRHPFVIDESELARQIGSLSGRQKGRDAVLARFFAKVDESAGYGLNQLALRYKTAAQGWTLIDGFNVSIGRRDLPLVISSVKAVPEIFVPGKSGTVEIEVANRGAGKALNARVMLNFTDSTPFAGYGSTNEAFIPIIQQEGRASATFSLIALPDAKSSVYRVPVIITYSDGSGRNYTLSGQHFGIAVGAAPQLSASVASSELLKLNVKAKATIELINNGLIDLKFATAKLQKSGSYEILSPESVYVGDIDSGDSETAGFEVFFTGKAPLLLEVEYSDALNNPYTQQIEVPVKVYSGSELRKFGLEKSGATGFLVTTIIVVVGVLAYRRFRRKK